MSAKTVPSYASVKDAETRRVARTLAYEVALNRALFDIHDHDSVKTKGGGGKTVSYLDLSNLPTLSYIATGTYTGDGTAAQAITGVGFKPQVVILWSQTSASIPQIKTLQDTAITKGFNGANNAIATFIVSFSDDGFTVGSDDAVNKAGDTFTFIAATAG